MAASNIEGNTLHSAFKFDFSHTYKSLSDKKRDELRNFFKNVQVVIIDEFSMMKNFQLYQPHMRLCDVKQTDSIMGGVAVLLVGVWPAFVKTGLSFARRGRLPPWRATLAIGVLALPKQPILTLCRCRLYSCVLMRSLPRYMPPLGFHPLLSQEGGALLGE